jgi:hypothetical protein
MKSILAVLIMSLFSVSAFAASEEAHVAQVLASYFHEDAAILQASTDACNMYSATTDDISGIVAMMYGKRGYGRMNMYTLSQQLQGDCTISNIAHSIRDLRYAKLVF